MAEPEDHDLNVETVDVKVATFLHGYLSKLAGRKVGPEEVATFLADALPPQKQQLPADQRQRTHRFMLAWFASFFVIFSAVATTFYLQRGLGNYTVVFTRNGASIWTDAPDGRNYPVGIIATCLLVIGGFGPLVFFSIRATKPSEYAKLGENPRLAPASHYLVFWLGTATMQCGMFLLAITAAGVCELGNVLSGGVTAFGALFVLYRVSYNEGWLLSALAIIFGLPMPLSVLLNLAIMPSTISSLDTVASALFLAQYVLCYAVLMGLSLHPDTSIYLHHDFFEARAARNAELARSLFLECTRADDKQQQSDCKAVGITAPLDRTHKARLVQAWFDEKYDKMLAKAEGDDKALTQTRRLQRWRHHDDQLRLRKAVWVCAGVLLLCSAGGLLYGLLASDAAAGARVTRSVCEVVVSDRRWPAAAVLLTLLFGLPAAVIAMVGCCASARRNTAREWHGKLPLSWRVLATGVALAVCTVMLMAAVGVTDMHLLIINGGLMLLGGFLQQSMRKPYDPAIQVTAVCAIVVPTSFLIAVAHAASVSSTRLALCYTNAVVSFLTLASGWLQECNQQRAYRVIEIGVCVLVFVHAIVLSAAIMAFELFRF